MNQKELSEIQRRLRSEKNNITHIYGCYVNSNREVISTFAESLSLMTRDEAEMYLNLLRKTLSGALGRTLLQIDFATRQVMDGEEHRLLSQLRKTALEDEILRESLYQRILESIVPEEGCNYLILLACDVYDVPHRGRDGERKESTDVFQYMLCCVCPVKSRNPELKYDAEERRFANAAMNQLVCPPAYGFMFPCFDDRMANIYSALFYSRNTEELNEEFIQAIFCTPVPMAPGKQRDSFHTAVAEVLDKDCCFDLVEAVHEQITDRIAAHKESKDPEPLVMSVEEIGCMLEDCGMKEERAEAFRKRFAQDFGGDALISPANILGSKNIEICTPEVKITVQPQFGHLIQARVIDGQKYIMISVPDGVQLNGIPVEIENES